MTPEMALAFVGTLLVLVLVPGPAILVVVGRSLTSGFRSTFSLISGISLWRKDPHKQPSGAAADEPGDAFMSFLTGFGITLGNPKAILFHLGFLPTFFDVLLSRFWMLSPSW